ncbi:hypothetical protein GXW78_11655 [Roseomonas terrae]|uniref:Tetratricopeptide repeat protein n=1 Tax=Neoroseomonas terrae TaxID=424799 RepID=A0ABS5EH27_9PROT|nr:hypothetical protein [Neoroseomonas terrae]MBR0650320.1 hypothetical protein [Neoroseomonas terrae]
MTQIPPKLAVPLAPLVPRLELDPDGEKAIAGADSASAGVDRLVAAGRYQDAVKLLAHALPKREAVWWACMCARAIPDAGLPPTDAAAIDAAEGWVRRPDEQARRAAATAAEKTKFATPESWAAMGAFWSGGSMAPDGQMVVPPPEHLTATAVTGSVMLAAVRHAPDKQKDRLERFVVSARDIAGGGAGRLQAEEPPPPVASPPPDPPLRTPPPPPAPPRAP